MHFSHQMTAAARATAPMKDVSVEADGGGGRGEETNQGIALCFCALNPTSFVVTLKDLSASLVEQVIWRVGAIRRGSILERFNNLIVLVNNANGRS